MPFATLDVAERETFELLSAVEQRRLNVAFVRIQTARCPSLGGVVLHEEAFVAALPLDHDLAGVPAPLQLASLMRERLVLYRRPDGVGIFDILMEGLRRAGFEPAVTDEVPRIMAAINLVAAGQGISFVPASMRAIHTEAVAYRAIATGSLPPCSLTLAYRRDEPSALVRNFIQVARGAAGAA